MSFTWSTVNKGTDINKTQIDEMKTNIDSVRSSIGLSPWTWTNIPVVVGNEIKNLEIEEIRNALDVTDNQNVCSANYSTFNSDHFSTNYGDHNNAEYGANACYQFCTPYYAPNYTTIQGVHYETNLESDVGCIGHYKHDGCAANYASYQGNHLYWRINSY